MFESPFQAVLRCFENVLRRNVPTLGLKEPDAGTFLYNTQPSHSPTVPSSLADMANMMTLPLRDTISGLPKAPLTKRSFDQSAQHLQRSSQAIDDSTAWKKLLDASGV